MPASASATTAVTPSDPLQSTLFSKLKWLMFFRLLLATSLFSSAVMVQLRDDKGESYSALLYGLIVAIYLFSAIYAALIKRVQNLAVFAYIQFFFDTLFITPLIYVTGGLESIFSFLYFLIIISASYLLFTPGAFYAATLSGICYAILTTLLATKVMPSYQDPSGVTHELSYVFYNVTINIFAFYLVAFLSSYLAEQLRRTGQALIEEQLNLRELEELNRKIVENIKSGLMTIDPQGRITFLNRAAQQMIGVKLENVFGTSVDQIFPATFDHLKDIHVDEDVILRPTRWERHFTRKDKQRFYLGFSTSPLRNQDGREVGNILIFEDLTRLKYLEEKARRDDRLTAVGRLAAGIAHEIRNPLASISGSIQVLRDELDLEDENRALMDIVLRETDRLNGLITDFLHYVRPTAVTRQPVGLTRLIQDVLEALRRNPKFHAGVELHTHFDHTARLEGDADQLRQVLWNLVLNAVEIMPEGGTLEVSTRDLPAAQDEANPRVEIAVADTGSGLEPSIQDRIFDPFFSTKPGGTGLGLALVEKIVQGHDGLVRARPGRVKGTVFEVILPASGPAGVSQTQPEEGAVHADG